MVPLVTVVCAGNFNAFATNSSKASYVPRTLIAQGSSHHAYLCPLLGSPSVKPFLFLPLPLPCPHEGLVFRLFAFARTVSLALAYKRCVLWFALAFAFV